MLEKILLFQGVQKQSLDALEKTLRPRSFNKGDMVIRQGDEGDALYLVITGRLKVVSSCEEGKEALLDFFGPNDYFGELALLDPNVRSASVIAVENSDLLCITRRKLMNFLQDNPEANLSLMRGLARRTRAISQNLSSLAQLDVYGRIARVIIQEAADEGGRLITPQLTQKEIGEMIGASREMVSRILKDLRTGGYISIEGRRIIVHRRLPAHW
ncbi:MAG: Crp/Fnr family transcriptional regulator [Gammaproteobacteria bacterium]